LLYKEVDCIPFMERDLMVGLHIWERKANSFPFLERYLQVGLQKRKSAGGFIPNREETAVFWGKRLPKKGKGAFEASRRIEACFSSEASRRAGFLTGDCPHTHRA
jgi:hypothetical protein